MAATRVAEERRLKLDTERQAQVQVELNMPASPSAMAYRIAPSRWDPGLPHTQLLDQALVYLEQRAAPAWWLRKYLKERRAGPSDLVPMACEGYDDDDLVPLTRLVIQEPPRHGKSDLCSKNFPAWYLGRHPWHRVMLASYQANMASLWSGRARDITETWGSTLFGRGVKRRHRARDDWELEGTDGGMTSSGVGGAMTGRGANALIIDDPVKNADEAQSETIQERNWDWFRSTAMSRLEVDEDGLEPIVLLIMTRWHNADLVGKILEQDADEFADEEHFVVLSLAAIAEENDVLGRTPGEALWPQRRTLRFLEGMRRRLGSYFFNALYQQHPTPPGGGIFERGWWRRYTRMPRRTQLGGIFIDTATDDKSTGDYFAMATIRTADLGFYWENVVNARLSFPDQIRAVMDAREASRRTPNGRMLPVYIEEVAWALPLITALKRLARGIIGVKPGGHSKIARAMAAAPYVEAGDCYLPEDAPWTGDFVEQHAAFPSPGWHDDMVDTTSLGLFVLGTKALPANTEPVARAIEYVENVAAPQGRTPSQRDRVRDERIKREQQRVRRQEQARPAGVGRRRGGV